MNFDKFFSFFENNGLTLGATMKWILLTIVSSSALLISGYLLHRILTFLLSQLSLSSALFVIFLETGIILGVATLYFFSLSKNHKLKKQINSLNQQIETLTMHAPDDKYFAHEAGVIVNRTKKMLECVRPHCGSPLIVEKDLPLTNCRPLPPYFRCTNGDYEYRPKDRAGYYLDAHQLRDELLKNL